MQILFVDNDDSQASIFKDAVTDWNAAQAGRRMEIVRATAVDEAKKIFAQRHLDAALIDLKLPLTAGAKDLPSGGNELAESTLLEVGMPIAIVSGYPEDLDAELAARPTVKVFNKGDTDVYVQVCRWLDSQWAMMAILASTRRHIQILGAKVFLQRLWPRWETYSGLTGSDQEELTRIVTRQYVGYIAEMIGHDGDGNASWHPYECFVQPALLDNRAHTGDLFRIDGKLWVVLTPACDMATGKAEAVLLAGIDEDGLSDWAEKVGSLHGPALSSSAQQKLDRYFNKLVNQNVDVSEHFLPPLNGGTPMMVRFKEVSVRQLEFLNHNLKLREASIAPAFLPNLVQRFGAWMSRTGQPNIDIRHFS